MPRQVCRRNERVAGVGVIATGSLDGRTMSFPSLAFTAIAVVLAATAAGSAEQFDEFALPFDSPDLTLPDQTREREFARRPHVHDGNEASIRKAPRA
ncbi:hypothetical protein MES5069_940008 [Mesorhizobium escarrei]|uniref:Uncharacterized protein n=1 Tax=Mesorhizobium escarrei TaxID=666018 RepID=A0ABM9EJS9_9HYPH|nr:hypothetical protein MES5069_940008 [Mesorhizobium escarrei]